MEKNTHLKTTPKKPVTSVKRKSRPKELALPAEGFARLAQVLHAFGGISKSALFNGIKKGIYPKPIRISTRTSVWLVTEIRETIQRLSEVKES